MSDWVSQTSLLRDADFNESKYRIENKKYQSLRNNEDTN